MIYGVGIDLVETSRIARILEKWKSQFITRVYSSYEADYCGKKASPHIHFAARFAAKESFLKSLGIGLWMGIDLRDIELTHEPDGRPVIRTYNRADTVLHEAGITSIQVSITHTNRYATAIVILENNR